MMSAIQKMTVRTENYPDGQYLTGVVVEYSEAFSEQNVSIDAFTVIDRHIIKAQPVISPDCIRPAAVSRFIYLQLDKNDPAAKMLTAQPVIEPGMASERKKSEGPQIPPAVRRLPYITLAQVLPLTAASGRKIEASGSMLSTDAIQPVVDDFVQDVFHGIPYNLYIPKTDHSSVQYPLVLFLHDAGPNGSDPLLTLVQGNGAIVWAEPESQAKHPCFVLAPQIPKDIHLTMSNFRAAPQLELLEQLIEDICRRYSIDRRRIYTTGQSQGCMASCELNIRYPDLFAASLLAAGQWDPETMAAKLAHHNLWILVSEGDARANPGMTAVTDALERAGARVGRYIWNGRADAAEQQRSVAAARADDVNIRFVKFAGSSVVPDNLNPDPVMNHICTWPVVYTISGLRDWLFDQKKIDEEEKEDDMKQ